jgi:hypothetical protein
VSNKYLEDVPDVQNGVLFSQVQTKIHTFGIILQWVVAPRAIAPGHILPSILKQC